MDGAWELINHPMSDETGQALADQMKLQNEILKSIASGACKGEKAIPERKARRETLVKSALKVRRVKKERRATPAKPARRERRATPAKPALKARRAKTVRRRMPA